MKSPEDAIAGDGLSSTVTTISNLWGPFAVGTGAVHSKRTGGSHITPDVIVVGDSPMERNVRDLIGARRVSDRSRSPIRFAHGRAVVAAAHYCDFAKVIGTKQAARRDEQAARAEQIVLDAMIAKVPHIVLISTAMVTGAAPNRPVIGDDEPLLQQDEGYVGDVVQFELAFGAAVDALPEATRPRVTILRPAAVVGPDIDTLVTRHFEAPRVLGIKGENKVWQFAHVTDVATAVTAVIEHKLYGTVVLGSVRAAEGDFVPDELTTPQLLDAIGMRGIEISKDTAFGTADKLHKVGVLPAPARDLEMAVYPWSVYPARLLEVGWRPTISSEQCAKEIAQLVQGRIGVAGRRVLHRDAAALGAAGAAVALLSTAAIWKQARSSH